MPPTLPSPPQAGGGTCSQSFHESIRDHNPRQRGELVDCVLDARAAKTPLSVQGGGTRVALGRPIQTARTVSTAGLAGITLHEPAEMIVSARAGTPLAEVEATLAEKGSASPSSRWTTASCSARQENPASERSPP